MSATPTPEDIAKARELFAAWWKPRNRPVESLAGDIAQAIADAREQEREACALIALSDEVDREWSKRTDGSSERWVIHEQIRARGGAR